MIRIIGILGLFFSSMALAQTTGYGYVRVALADQNKDHNSIAELVVNNHGVLKFRHSNEGRPLSQPYGWVALGIQHLNTNSNSTTVKAVYNLDKGCEFTYYIQFSFDQQTIAYTSPPLHAPSNDTSVTIPIGTNCKSGMRVCSSDPNLQRQLEQGYKKALVVNYNNWKAQYDGQLKSRIAKSEADAQKSSTRLKQTSLPDFEKGRKLLEETIDKWQKEFNSVREEAERLDKGLKLEPENSADEAKKVVDSAIESTIVQQAAENSKGALEKTKESFRSLVREDKELYEALLVANDGSATPQMKRNHEIMKQSSDLLIHDFMEFGIVQKVAPKTIEYTSIVFPQVRVLSLLGTAVKLCKIWGRELCYGPELTTEERAKALCELVGKHAINDGLKFKKVLENMSAEDRLITKKIESMARSGLCARITADLID